MPECFGLKPGFVLLYFCYDSADDDGRNDDGNRNNKTKFHPDPKPEKKINEIINAEIYILNGDPQFFQEGCGISGKLFSRERKKYLDVIQDKSRVSGYCFSGAFQFRKDRYKLAKKRFFDLTNRGDHNFFQKNFFT
jgi:hypothetical protein